MAAIKITVAIRSEGQSSFATKRRTQTYKEFTSFPYLVFIQFTVFESRLSFRLKGDNNETNENVDHKEGNDNNVDEIEDGNCWPEFI